MGQGIYERTKIENETVWFEAAGDLPLITVVSLKPDCKDVKVISSSPGPRHLEKSYSVKRKI